MQAMLHMWPEFTNSDITDSSRGHHCKHKRLWPSS